METRRIGRTCRVSPWWTVSLVVSVMPLLALVGCEVEPEPEPKGSVTVEDTLASELGTCQVVLAVENTGEVEINELDIVFSITTDARRYYRRIVEGGTIPPGETAGLVEEVTLDSPEETVDSEATKVEWRCFS
jgi:hypothetical protein